MAKTYDTTPSLGLSIVDGPISVDSTNLNNNFTKTDQEIAGPQTTIASATTTSIGGVASHNVSITGTTTITGFGTANAGLMREGVFTGILTLTYNATSLILPGAASITTAAGDSFRAISLGSGNWLVYDYTPASGRSVIASAPSLILYNDFADVGNTTTSETTLYSHALPAGAFATNGEKVFFEAHGIFVQSATATREIKAKFGTTNSETTIYDSGALTVNVASAAWSLRGTLIRVSSTVVRCIVTLTVDGLAFTSPVGYTEVTGLTLTNANTLKTTGQAGSTGAATNDIVAKLGTAMWVGAS